MKFSFRWNKNVVFFSLLLFFFSSTSCSSWFSHRCFRFLSWLKETSILFFSFLLFLIHILKLFSPKYSLYFFILNHFCIRECELQQTVLVENYVNVRKKKWWCIFFVRKIRISLEPASCGRVSRIIRVIFFFSTLVALSLLISGYQNTKIYMINMYFFCIRHYSRYQTDTFFLLLLRYYLPFKKILFSFRFKLKKTDDVKFVAQN